VLKRHKRSINWADIPAVPCLEVLMYWGRYARSITGMIRLYRYVLMTDLILEHGRGAGGLKAYGSRIVRMGEST
jgi:hypothetical protein